MAWRGVTYTIPGSALLPFLVRMEDEVDYIDFMNYIAKKARLPTVKTAVVIALYLRMARPTKEESADLAAERAHLTGEAVLTEMLKDHGLLEAAYETVMKFIKLISPPMEGAPPQVDTGKGQGAPVAPSESHSSSSADQPQGQAG